MKRLLMFIILSIFISNIIPNVNANIVQANEHATSVQQSDRLERIKQKGVLTVLSPDAIPYSYKDPISGEFSGLDADIIKEIARRLGANKVDARYLAFPYIIEELVNNPEIDLIAQGFYATAGRKNLVNFTTPIYTEVDAILTRKDTNINNKDTLKNKVIGVIGDTVYEDMAKNWKNQGLIKTYTRFFDNNSLYLALEHNVVDAIITDSIMAESALLQRPNLNLKLLSPNQYKPEINLAVGYALKKEDTTLLNAINQTIKEMKDDGTLYSILAKRSLISHYIP
ncbi:substrate-binding periplasmic protein [Inconstantimicrobium mannanitabidum]|uniref:Basic amino acid ABC transporter substrate-binding protein n=1 Tax=Inconstantimicrobium mannanitabidum TaxID=1604901 RepID=A0ACB5RHN5_9CLOT|nr:ABC transporter substrate-binding protein [Clostridium sp. TW13]GKX68597.1 basic amino acid ABC transporter substrate-binding protein [Clostridium sp. TW13]